jgi:hypothetical protein
MIFRVPELQHFGQYNHHVRYNPHIVCNSILLDGGDLAWSNLPKPSLESHHFPANYILGGPSAVIS